jgi:hypothetical protein
MFSALPHWGYVDDDDKGIELKKRCRDGEDFLTSADF